ncbi:YitT family protein [Hymenobacter sp. H14-R3]|uniref:YitT family protein n=1 Tax=Hymenobacter sp. H14-R3 TaxID=3046308 RepID=UPI0024BA5D6D|nr:YitT family protein [Hymenobacter sp. H14-R3]MDJ0367103.1 YitT family protein [Hymenobacter sp. H14-R3]
MLAQLSVLQRMRLLRASAAAIPSAASEAALATIADHPAMADHQPPKSSEPWLRQQLRSILYLVAGVFSAALALEAFILPSGLFDGGVTGISLLAARFIPLPLSVFLVALNLPFIWLGYRQLGKDFAIRALLAILALAIVLETVHFPVVTQDKMLIAVFGGFFLGAGIGLAMRGGGVLDGTEILAVYLSRKASLSVGDFVLMLNILIFLIVAVVLDVPTALYSILTYLAASKTIEFVVNGIEEYTGVTIISEHSDAIRRALTERLGRGVTVYAGHRGYGSHGEQPSPIDIVFTVVTRLEVSQVTDEVNRIDPKAFTIMHSVNDAKGGMVKKRALH